MSLYHYGVAYKPYGVLCKHYSDRLGRDTLSSMGIPTYLQPAGRLDLDSEGLLVLMDDGQTLHRLTHPHFSHAKTYFALILGRPDVEALRQLREGVEIKLGRTRPANIEILAGSPAIAPCPEPYATAGQDKLAADGTPRGHEPSDQAYDRGGWTSDGAIGPRGHWGCDVASGSGPRTMARNERR